MSRSVKLGATPCAMPMVRRHGHSGARTYLTSTFMKLNGVAGSNSLAALPE